MGEFLDFFKQKKNLARVLILGILILALPLGRDLIKRQQILKSRADQPPIVFEGNGVSQKDGKWVSTTPQVSLKITSPLGPAGTTAPGAAPATWSGNLLSADMQNASLNKGADQLVQWFSDPGTYTISGSVSSTPDNNAYSPYAVIQADEYSGSTYVTTHANNTTFTISQGRRIAVILRAINAKATFKNVSVTRGQSQNLLGSAMQNATISSGSTQKVQWFADSGKYSLSGNASSSPVAGVDPSVAVIQADEYSGNTYVTTHANNTTFTVPAGHKIAVILRVINANATFSNVSLKKQQ